MSFEAMVPTADLQSWLGSTPTNGANDVIFQGLKNLANFQVTRHLQKKYNKFNQQHFCSIIDSDGIPKGIGFTQVKLFQSIVSSH